MPPTRGGTLGTDGALGLLGDDPDVGGWSILPKLGFLSSAVFTISRIRRFFKKVLASLLEIVYGGDDDEPNSKNLRAHNAQPSSDGHQIKIGSPYAFK